ncbi:MAG: PaaI family thioesterase [Rhizomicrobium sp.]
MALGASVVEAVPGRSVMRLPYAPHLVGNPETGVVHGGAITGLLDHACGMAVSSGVEAVRPNSQYGMRGLATLDLRIDYLKSAKPGMDIFVVGECTRVTRQIVFARGRAFQESEDEPIALATGAFMLTEMRTG